MNKSGRKPSARLAEAVARVLAGETVYAVANDMSASGPKIWHESLYRAVKKARETIRDSSKTPA